MSLLFRYRSAWILFGILLIAASLRSPITALGPILEPMSQALALSPVAAGLLATLPLLAFAFLSPLSTPVAARLGIEPALLLALLLLVGGIGLRSVGDVPSLFVGTAVLGCGIALGNVLLPALLKLRYPNRIPLLTGAYAMIMGLSATLASWFIVPLNQALGWRGALLSLGLLPVLAVIVWALCLRGQCHDSAISRPAMVGRSQPVPALWRHPLAWQVALFMGFNSVVFHTTNTWLPALLTEQGFSLAQAGRLHGGLHLSGAIAGLLLVPLMRVGLSASTLAAAISLITLLGYVGLWAAPAQAPIWIGVFGAGSGLILTLALSFIALRANSPLQAVALSAMVQSCGYLMAAVGPVLFGGLFAWSGSWHALLPLWWGLLLCTALFGALAGRERTL
ncbi:MFS transporter [Ferrimonas pelagia]|uniref:CynX/NimT family MFS transporter n=1 Tax=Ferrimonas pelagia TaxID=1177826 RepID=A0ABP9EP55_9GAMM